MEKVCDHFVLQIKYFTTDIVFKSLIRLHYIGGVSLEDRCIEAWLLAEGWIVYAEKGQCDVG